MKRCTGLLVAFAWVFTAGSGLAQETYNIQLKKAPKGTTLHAEKTDANTESVKIFDIKGASLKDSTKKETAIWGYDETILERPDLKKMATSLKRVYQKATAKIGDETTVLPYQGKTVLIDKKGDKYQFRYENGGEITGKDAEHLDKEFNKDSDAVDPENLLLPSKAVAVNESWKIAMPEFLKEFEKSTKMKVDAQKASGSGKLVKAFKKDGRQYGDLVIDLDLPVKTAQTDGGEIQWQPGTLMKIQFKTTACIDGSVDDAKGDWSIQFNGKTLLPSPDNPMARLELAVRNTSDVSVKELTKK
jgi:hypothetical protein